MGENTICGSPVLLNDWEPSCCILKDLRVAAKKTLECNKKAYFLLPFRREPRVSRLPVVPRDENGLRLLTDLGMPSARRRH